MQSPASIAAAVRTGTSLGGAEETLAVLSAIERHDRMLEAQGGRCAICRGETPLGRGRWHIDHDHVTGQVRGLLCNNCNRGIGYFGDDPEVMAAAVRYLARHRVN